MALKGRTFLYLHGSGLGVEGRVSGPDAMTAARFTTFDAANGREGVLDKNDRRGVA